MASTVRLQALDGRWETVGVDRLRGVQAEGLECSANGAGADTCSFTLRRTPGGIFPDLTAFTPCDIEVEGQKVWSGRIWETPTKEGSDSTISVQGRGWQYALDDDVYDDWYVINDLSKWVDTRTIDAVPLTTFKPAPVCQQEGGMITIGWPAGSWVATGDFSSITLDLGEACQIGVNWNFQTPFGASPHADFRIYLRHSDTPDPSAAGTTDIIGNVFADTIPAGSYSHGGGNTFSSAPRRYLHFFLYYAGGGGDNGVSTRTLSLKQMHVYKKPKYTWYWPSGTGGASGGTGNVSGDQMSTLRASDIIEDAILQGAPGIKEVTQGSSKWEDEALATPNLRGFWRMGVSLNHLTGADEVPDLAKVYTGTNAQPGGGEAMDLQGTYTAGVTGIVSPSDPINDPDDKAITFDGTSGCATTLNNFANDATLQAGWYWMEWIGKMTVPDLGCLCYFGNTGTNGYGLFVGDNGVAPTVNGTDLWLLHGGVAWYKLNETMVSGTWYHIVAYRIGDGGGGITYVFINGVLRYNSATGTANDPAGRASVAGSWNGTTMGYFLNCTVDECLVGYGGIRHAPISPLDGTPSTQDLAVQHYQAAMDRKSEKVQRSTFNIPEYNFIGNARTPREVAQAANSFHDWIFQVDVEKEVVFKPRPKDAVYDVGEWSGAEFEDASANSAEEIYNKVRGEGTGPDGLPLAVTRNSYNLAGAPLILSPGQVYDPSGDVGGGWREVASGGYTCVYAIDATVYSSAQYSHKFTFGPGGQQGSVWNGGLSIGPGPGLGVGENSWNDPDFIFQAGQTYILSLDLCQNAVGTCAVTVRFGGRKRKTDGTMENGFTNATDYTTLTIPETGPANCNTTAQWNATYTQRTLVWTPRHSYPAREVAVDIWPTSATVSKIIRFDNVYVYVPHASLLDRRGQTRSKILPINSRVTSLSLTQICDIWLASHLTTPFKGRLNVKGTGGVRETRGGRKVHPSELLLKTGQKINFSHRVDPDTGALGRLGDIASVSYNDATGEARVEIDNQRQRFESLLERLAVVTGQIK